MFTLMAYLRNKKGITQVQVGQMVGISQPRVSFIERGEVYQLDTSLGSKFEDLYDRPIQELLEEVTLISKNHLALIEMEQILISLVKGKELTDEIRQKIKEFLHKTRKERKRRERQMWAE